MSEYTTKNGINYREDGYAFCDRCGRRPIINNKCLNCDVQPTEDDRKLAHELNIRCFSQQEERQPGFRDARPESFDEDLAARILAAQRVRTIKFPLPCPIHGISYILCECQDGPRASGCTCMEVPENVNGACSIHGDV